MRTRLLLTALLPPVISGCIPAMKTTWDVNPVTTHLYDIDTCSPIANATMRHVNDPTLTTTSNTQGQANIPEQTHLSFQLLMAGHALRFEPWRIEHSDYRTVDITSQHTLQPIFRDANVLYVPLQRRAASQQPPSQAASVYFLYLDGDSPLAHLPSASEFCRAPDTWADKVREQPFSAAY